MCEHLSVHAFVYACMQGRGLISCGARARRHSAGDARTHSLGHNSAYICALVAGGGAAWLSHLLVRTGRYGQAQSRRHHMHKRVHAHTHAPAGVAENRPACGVGLLQVDAGVDQSLGLHACGACRRACIRAGGRMCEWASWQVGLPSRPIPENALPFNRCVCVYMRAFCAACVVPCRAIL